MAMQMFVKSARIQQAVVLINKLDNSKFPLLLTRILQKLHLKEEIFTKEESAKLEISLFVDQEGLKLILQTLTFIFQQAAYHIAKPAVLAQQLEQLEISDEKGMLRAYVPVLWIFIIGLSELSLIGMEKTVTLDSINNN